MEDLERGVGKAQGLEKMLARVPLKPRGRHDNLHEDGMGAEDFHGKGKEGVSLWMNNLFVKFRE
jgi:hypothetical protein